MNTFLTLVSGIAWTLVYIDAIRIGIKDKTYAMPLYALALNLAWEGIYGYLALTNSAGISLQGIINVLWFLFDLGLAYTFFRYGRRYLPPAFSNTAFYAWGVLAFVTGFLVQLIFLDQFGRQLAVQYSAFLQNLLMSVLFIGMFTSRKGTEGQTLFIAIAKWIGTLAPTILFGFLAPSLFIAVLGLLCSVFDLIYIGLVWWARRQPLSG